MSKDLATIKTDLDLEIPTNLSETIFDNKVLEDSGNEISKYELNRFLGERTNLNKMRIKRN